MMVNISLFEIAVMRAMHKTLTIKLRVKNCMCRKLPKNVTHHKCCMINTIHVNCREI